MTGAARPLFLDGRPTHGASVAPDGGAVAHIVDDGGYPRAVQRFLDGVTVSSWRYVTLPVEGPITRVLHSPDGHWLACEVSPHGADNTQVWVVTTDPRDPEAWRVDDRTDGAAELVGWDGNRIMVTAERPDGLGESRLVDPATLEVTVLDRRPEGRLLDAWRGATLVRVGRRGDRAVRLLWAGADTPLLRADPGSVTDTAVILDDHHARWVPGPGGPRLAPHHRFPGRRGGYLRVLARTDVDADRQHLLLCTVTPDGTFERVLAARADTDLDTFAVSADGSRAVLLWNVRGGASEVQVLELTDGTLQAPLTLPAAEGGPYVASEPSLSADGSILALTVEHPGADRTVELVDLRSAATAEVDRPVRTPARPRPTLERITAADGLPLTGWLYRATDASDGGPLLVQLHGGPEGQERPGHSHLYPVLLEAGISVFAPNVRGSGGFGRAFSHADDGPLRPAGIRDVANVVAELVRRGIADPDRVGLAGWSYGGYLTMAALAFHPGLAACGVSVCGMSDLRTFYAGTEPWIGRAATTKYGDPERDADLLAELSPLGRAADVRAPLLLLHGANDTNVPPAESLQMAEAVTAAGGHARAVLIEGEGGSSTLSGVCPG